MLNRSARVLLIAVALILALPARGHAQVILVSPTAVRITVSEPPPIATFHLALYTDLSATPPAATLAPAAQVDLVAPAPTSPGVYLLPLAALLSQVGPPQRSLPLLLWVTAVNASGSKAPLAASGTLTINAPLLPPNTPLSVVLVP